MPKTKSKPLSAKDLVRLWGDAHWNFDPQISLSKRDPWGHAMNVWFGVSDYLFVFSPLVPPWNYRPGGAVSQLSSRFPSKWSDEDVARQLGLSLHQLHLLQDTPNGDLLHLGNVLDRYTRILDKKGLSY